MTTQQPLITPFNHQSEELELALDDTLDPASVDSDDDTVPRQSARPDTAASYLPEQTSAQANAQWQRIQADFVDDPRKSVAAAHQLVGAVVQQIVDAFARERSDLERQWSKGDEVSTEDLRISLQRYRAFFSRLLPSINGH